MACLTSASVNFARPCCNASNDARFITDSIFAHEKPSNSRARTCAEQDSSVPLFRVYISTSCTLASKSGKGTFTRASKRPGLINASSSALMLFVAARTRIPSFDVKPSSSLRRAVTIRVFSVSIAYPE